MCFYTLLHFHILKELRTQHIHRLAFTLSCSSDGEGSALPMTGEVPDSILQLAVLSTYIFPECQRWAECTGKSGLKRLKLLQKLT